MEGLYNAMRAVRAKKIRRFCRQAMEMFPDLINKYKDRSFYRFAKKQWNRDKWKTLKQGLV